MKKTFLICPVRGHDEDEYFDVVSELEMNGWHVHWPPRDTNQDDPIGYQICIENLNAIKDADVIHFIWDGKSTGSLFDLGMAFALKKLIIPVEMPPLTDYKSFQNMVNEWAGRED
jgi:nucleoside 2-deoxyribosyltransferase